MRKWTSTTPGRLCASRATTRVRGVAHALPTKTLSPGRTIDTALSADTRRSCQSCAPTAVIREAQRYPRASIAVIRHPLRQTGGLEGFGPALKWLHVHA